ncbi:MAG: hypothetical protein GC159_01845 [Phycisphaera sp.]|nr:hypothetical protein [Phycisphaera sp.]
MRNRSRSGFTIVELLVVVSIIMLLVSLLLPSMQKARAVTRQAVCAAQLSQVNMAQLGYLADNWQTFPINTYGASGWKTFWMQVYEPYHANLQELRFCPEAVEPNPHHFFGTNTLAWNGKLNSGQWIHTGNEWKEGSYGLNAWVYSNHTTDTRYFRTLQRIRFTSQTPLFADCRWVDGWPVWTDAAPPDLQGDPYHANTGVSNTARFAIDRHLGAINVQLTDGSVNRWDLRDLHQLIWWANPWTRQDYPVPSE